MNISQLRLEWVDPDTLSENPRNWRIHTERQVKALAQSLEKVGWAGALLYNERTGRLIDGHARLEWARRQHHPVPVLVGSWSEEDESFIVASLDPITGMAQADEGKLMDLLKEIARQDQAGAVMAELIAQHEKLEQFIQAASAPVQLGTGPLDDTGDMSSPEKASASSVATDTLSSRTREDMTYFFSVRVSYEQKLLIELAMDMGYTLDHLLELGARVVLGER